MISPTTDAEGAANTVTPAVPDHDVDDENRIELGRARQRQSLGVPHDYPGLAGATCEAVRSRRGRACVAPCPRCLPGGAGLARSGHSVSVYGWYYARDRYNPSLLITCGIVHVRMAPCGRHNLPQGWVPGARVRVLRDARRVLTPASGYTVQRRNWLNPGLGEHHGYQLGTSCASDRVARPRPARVSVRAPCAKSAPKGHPFRG